MKRLLLCLSIVPLCLPGVSQSLNSSQQVVLAGLRAASGQGSFRAAAYAVDGSLILLYDQGDGVRVLKTDASGSTILAQSLTGSTGDSGVAIALDPVGNIYVAGTTTSNALRATSGAAFPSRADTTTNSFVAKYDTNLNLVFLTFLGSGRTVAASVAATADAVFVTGVTFNTQFPVTPPGIQQAPALNSTENGFVERFNANGSTLVYATYLTGANGETTPTVIAADTSDNAYITGSTSATGYPTIKAIQPVILGSTSGFLSSLTPAGDGFVYSTFLAGTGITGMALDEGSNSLVLTGGISLGQFPIMTVSMPIAATSYQTLLRIPLDGQSVTSSVLLVPGSQSHVSTGSNGDAWVTGSLTTPLFPGTVPPDYSAGDSFLIHLTSSSTFDQTLRFGGTPTKNVSYATLVSSVAAPAVNAAEIAVPGTLQTGIFASLLSTQRFDLPLVKSPNSGPLPNVIHDALPTAAACTSQCTGSAGLITIVRTAESAPSLSLSTDDLPNVILRNMGSATAAGLSIAANGFNIATNCGATLAPSSQCSLALSGSGPGSIVVSSSNAPTATAMLGLSASPPDPIALSTAELDFGVTAADSPTARTVTVSNLTSVTQTVVSQLAAGPSSAATFSESASDCPDGGASGEHRIAPNSSCHITLSLRVSPSSANDGPVRATWMIGTRVLVVTGFAQAAALSVSATLIDFGTHFSGYSTPAGANLPRYLYISNNGGTPVSHTAVSLSPDSPFSVQDTCPSVLDSHSVCQMKLTYSPVNSPSQDSVSLSLDNGISVLLTGTTLPPPTITGSSANPSLSVSTTNLTFVTPVIVTGVSSAMQSLLLKNTGASPFALSITSSGDFQLTNGCPSQLLGGASCTILVGFAPSQPGMRLGLLSLVAGNGFAPMYISLSGTALAVLPASNGTLDFGETYIGEPEVLWLKVQQQVASLTASSSSSAFGLALVQDMGGGHGTLPASDFTPTVTGTCVNCWLGVQFLPPTASFQAGTLSLSTTPSGNPY